MDNQLNGGSRSKPVPRGVDRRRLSCQQTELSRGRGVSDSPDPQQLARCAPASGDQLMAMCLRRQQFCLLAGLVLARAESPAQHAVAPVDSPDPEWAIRCRSVRFAYFDAHISILSVFDLMFMRDRRKDPRRTRLPSAPPYFVSVSAYCAVIYLRVSSAEGFVGFSDGPPISRDPLLKHTPISRTGPEPGPLGAGRQIVLYSAQAFVKSVLWA